MVHRREVNGQILVLGNHGALWGNAMTWWDHSTGSIWSQPLGEAIAGPLKGERLDLLPVTFTTWDAWRTAHPHTLALDAPAGDSGFDFRDMAIVVELGTEAAAYRVPDLQRVGVANDVVAGLEIAVAVHPRDPQQWTVFSRRLENGVVELAVTDGELVDLGTGTVWEPTRGLGLDGPLAGQVLGTLPAFTAFPGDFDTFWPDGRVWQP